MRASGGHAVSSCAVSADFAMPSVRRSFRQSPGATISLSRSTAPGATASPLARAVLGLESSISMDVAFPNRTGADDPDGPNLWEFAPERRASLTGERLPDCTEETGTGQGLRLARDIYRAEGSSEQSLPVLYDKRAGRIVSNESAEILRMLDRHAEGLGSTRPDRLYPEPPELREEIEALNTQIYVAINNGAYKAGFSSDQSVYETAFEAYFAMLSTLEHRLSDGRPFLTGAAVHRSRPAALSHALPA